MQGLTEFLPVSSSGHLILFPRLFGWPDQGLGFDAAIHLGTLAALLVYFRRELGAMLAGGERRLALLIVAATAPAGVAGLLFEKAIEVQLRSPEVVAASLIVWGLVMGAADHTARRRRCAVDSPAEVGWGTGLLVGLAQALALIPGTSRSGITITAGLFGGMDRTTAARFAFLLGIPVTAAAGGLKMLSLLGRGLEPALLAPLAVGLVASFAAGFCAVWFLVNLLQRGSLMPFVVYRCALGILILGLTR